MIRHNGYQWEQDEKGCWTWEALPQDSIQKSSVRGKEVEKESPVFPVIASIEGAYAKAMRVTLQNIVKQTAQVLAKEVKR